MACYVFRRPALVRTSEWLRTAGKRSLPLSCSQPLRHICNPRQQFVPLRDRLVLAHGWGLMRAVTLQVVLQSQLRVQMHGAAHRDCRMAASRAVI